MMMMMMQMADEQVVPLMTSNPHKRKKQDWAMRRNIIINNIK
jgi:hypothetical protein